MFSCRPCEPKDAVAWIRLNRAFMRYEIQDETLWSGALVADEDFRETFQEALKSPDLIRMLIFEEDGIPVGFANTLLIFSVWSHGKALILDDLFFREEARGKGYGKAALQYIEHFAQSLGCKRLQFQSESTNPKAKIFYEAMGYMPAEMYFYVKYI